MTKNKKIISFKDSGNNMLMVSERRDGESKSAHKQRMVLLQQIMITKARELHEKNFDALIDEYLSLF